jgi:UDP-glucose 4-epimerase
LVTGVAGFIGSHLAEGLIGKGHEVFGVDNFSEYYPKKIKLSNISGLRESKAFRFLDADLASTDISKLLEGVEYVFHLAAQPGVRASWGNSFSQYVKDNITATQRLLEAAKEEPLKRLIFASSSSIYGDSERLPTSEGTLPRPVSPYGATKLAAESLCNVYFRNFNLPSVVLRYFTVYGPRQRPDMAFHRFIERLSIGEEIQIYGAGEQARDYTFVADTVAATISAMDAAPGSKYNVGTGTSISLNSAVSLIAEILGVAPRIARNEKARGDVLKTSADIRAIVRDVGYKPRVSLGDGLRKQIDWETGQRMTRGGIP